MATTVKDVAEVAGVSTQTVSRVLNESPAVLPTTRQRVLRAMARLGYHPDGVARSLRQRRTRTLGLLFSNIHNPGFVSEIRGIDEIISDAHHTVILCNSDESLEQEGRLAGTLVEHRVSGVLFIPVGDESRQTLRLFRKAGIPVVVLNRSLRGADLVTYDNRSAGRMAAQHLIRLGHRRLAVISAPQSVITTRERCEGCRAALADAGIPADGLAIEQAGFDAGSGHSAARRLFDRAAGERPSALITLTNFATLGALRALGELGLRVPADVALVAFGDPDWASVVNPPLTTIAADPTSLGRRAAELLLDRLHGGRPRTPRQETIPMELRIRASCGARRWGEDRVP